MAKRSSKTKDRKKILSTQTYILLAVVYFPAIAVLLSYSKLHPLSQAAVLTVIFVFLAAGMLFTMQRENSEYLNNGRSDAFKLAAKWNTETYGNVSLNTSKTARKLIKDVLSSTGDKG